MWATEKRGGGGGEERLKTRSGDLFPSERLYLSSAPQRDEPLPSGTESLRDLGSTPRVFELLIVQSLWPIGGGVGWAGGLWG